jgi:hypothetical protein
MPIRDYPDLRNGYILDMTIDLKHVIGFSFGRPSDACYFVALVIQDNLSSAAVFAAKDAQPGLGILAAEFQDRTTCVASQHAGGFTLIVRQNKFSRRQFIG